MERKSDFDDALGAIARHHKSIDDLLDTFFSWIRRSTDFYDIRTSESDTKGFYEGAVEEKLLYAFRKHKKIHAKQKQRQRVGTCHNEVTSTTAHQPPLHKSQTRTSNMDTVDVFVSNISETFRNDTNHMKVVLSKLLGEKGICLSCSYDGSVAHLQLSSLKAAEWLRDNIHSDIVKHSGLFENGTDPIEVKIGTTSAEKEKFQRCNTETNVSQESSVSSSAKEKKIIDSLSEYNGAKLDKYTWSQTGLEVNVEYILPHRVTKQDIEVRIDFKHLLVKVKGEILTDGELCERVQREDSQSMWLLENKVLSITLFKEQEKLWTCVVLGDPARVPTELRSTKNAYEYDDATRAHIQKIVYDEARKRQGLPTTEQMENEELLKKAWNAEGSPFKGTSVDLSKINFTH